MTVNMVRKLRLIIAKILFVYRENWFIEPKQIRQRCRKGDNTAERFYFDMKKAEKGFLFVIKRIFNKF